MNITSEMLNSLPENLRKRIEREVSSQDVAHAAASLRTALRTLLSEMEDTDNLGTLRLASGLPGLYSTALAARKSAGDRVTKGRPIGS